MGLQRTLPALVGTVSAAVLLTALLGHAQAPAQGAAPQPGAGGGRGGSENHAALWTAFDADKDSSVTRAEMKSAFDNWYDAADTAKSGSISTDQLATALERRPAAAGSGGRAGGGWRRARRRRAGRSRVRRSRQSADDGSDALSGRRDEDDGGAVRRPRPPSRPSRGRSSSSATRAATCTRRFRWPPRRSRSSARRPAPGRRRSPYDPADINAKNLEQYDALFLSSTTGCFLDAKTTEPPASAEEVEARKAALIGFVRGGKGLAGIHATGDSYHSPCANDAGAGAGRGGGGGRRRHADDPGRHAGRGHPALVVGRRREEASGRRPDAEEGGHGSGERRDVRAARYGEGRQGLPGQFHDAHRSARHAGEPVRRHARAATPAMDRGRTGTP